MYKLTWNLNGLQQLDFSNPGKAFEMFAKCYDELPEYSGKTHEELDIRLHQGELLLMSSATLSTVEMK